jgi:hypothetical protein
MSGRFTVLLLGLIVFLCFSTISRAQPVVCGTYGSGCYYNNGYGCNCNDYGEGYLFGGGYDRGRDVHNYSHRGFESRGAAHSGGGRGGRR